MTSHHGRSRARPHRVVRGTLLLALVVPWVTTAQVGRSSTPAESAECQKLNAPVRAGLSEVLRDFQAAPSPPPIETLVLLDTRIRALIDSRPVERPCSDELAGYDRRWKQIGVETGYWNELRYSGQLLVEAHARNPRSPWRSRTLFSTVFGILPAHGLGVMPDIAAAFAYAAEFPKGPFAREVYRTIAGFHKDLFMVLRDRLSDFKFECYRKYIRSGPWPPQQEAARAVALDYYRRVLTVAPGDEFAARYADEVSRGVVRDWSFCSD